MTVMLRMASVTRRLADLDEAVNLVRTSVVEDRPDDPDHGPDHKALADLRDTVDDLVDAVAHARWGLQAGPDGTPDLPAVQRAVLQAAGVLDGELLRIDRRFDTARRAAWSWGRAWHPWTAVVLTNLLEAGESLRATQLAVAEAWHAAVPSSAGEPIQDLEDQP